MKCIILLAVLAVAISAPVENDDLAVRVRRAQEIVMFGNAQNESKDKVKRSEEDENNDVDENGKIISLEPVQLEPETDETDVETNEESDVKNELEGINNGEENVEQTLDGTSDESTGAADDESVPLEPEEDAPNSEESESNEPPEMSTEIASNEDDMNEDLPLEESEDPFADFKNYLQIPDYDMLYNKQKPSFDYYDFYQQYPYLRKRRSQERIFLGGKAGRSRILKRSRRIKRDLIYPSESLDSGYMYGDDYPRNSNAYNDLVGYLLDLLDEKYNEESSYNNGVYGYDEPYEVDPYEELEAPMEEELVYPGYGESELEDAISKRQAGLTFVPGFKRNFYPYFKEPASHFQAFVPEKRTSDEYADAYRRVMGLASALRQSDYYPPGRYQEYDFRRK